MNNGFKEYKDKHKGEICYIVANGPSLNDTDLDLLDGKISIAMNKISLAYERTTWRPTYYLFASSNVNHKVWGDSWTDSVRISIKTNGVTSFIGEKFRKRIDPKGKYDHVNWFSEISETKPNIQGDIDPSCFSTDLIERIDKSGTSVNMALQMAYWFGFSEICFIGADLGWVKDTGSTHDPNHFDPSYRADISNPVKANYQMRNVHSLALEKFKKKGGVKIYNASLKTILDTYPIIDLEDYVNGKITLREDDMKEAYSSWDGRPQYAYLKEV